MAGLTDDAELGRNLHTRFTLRQEAAQQFLVMMRPIHIGRVKEIDALRDRSLQDFHGGFVIPRALELAQPCHPGGAAAGSRTADLDAGPEASMKLKLEISPDLAALMQAEIAAGERAVTTAMREAGAGLKSAWRGQITSAGLGTRLGNSIRLATYPKGGESLNAAALVWSNAPVIVGAHDTGPLIRSRNGFWLAIPTPAAGKYTRGGRITPGEWERRTSLRLRFIYRRRGPSLLVAEGRLNSKGRAVASRSKTGRGLTTVPIFLLVPQVKLRKRLDLARDAERAIDGVPGRIAANWVDRGSSGM